MVTSVQPKFIVVGMLIGEKFEPWVQRELSATSAEDALAQACRLADEARIWAESDGKWEIYIPLQLQEVLFHVIPEFSPQIPHGKIMDAIKRLKSRVPA